MGYDGVVVGGRVEVAGPVPLPDGTPVRVEPVAPPTLFDQLQHLIGRATGLPPDASVNHDHYLYGTPKQQP
jgi:hypothetical protein